MPWLSCADKNEEIVHMQNLYSQAWSLPTMMDVGPRGEQHVAARSKPFFSTHTKHVHAPEEVRIGGIYTVQTVRADTYIRACI